MTPDRASLLAAIAALETQRQVLGDAVMDLALAPLRQLLEATEPAAAPQLRRAQVTVLFADIVESTALASRLDAEDVLQVFGGVLQRAAACVRARGGRVLRYTGDGLKAGFGTQGTREDDAVQAVLAGLDILAAAREHAEWVAREHGLQGFALRVGAHTGEVALGAGFEADNTLTGDTVNIAARMEQAAPAGGLRISAETWAHVRGQFDGQPQPPLAVKGMAEPMATWLVQAARGGAGTVERGIAGLAIPMIGRDAERATLTATIDAARGGPLQALTVVADAGIGKTRLLREALADAAAGGARLLVVRAHPGAELRPWGLLHGLLSVHCGISDSDSAEQARAKLLAGLAPQLGDDPPAAAQRIGQLLGMDFGDVPALKGLDARALRDLAFADLIRWLGGLCTAGAVVLVFEDLHWADEASLDALAHWFVQARDLPLALLMSTRPALLERRPAWCQAEPTCRLLPLEALPEAERQTLADALLQRIASPPAALRALLIERTDGNPFYMEELLRRLLDDGVIRREGAVWRVDAERLQGLRLPTTLVGLLQARLDALPPAERSGVQHASIVGHVFWDDALAQVDPAAAGALEALQRRQWVRQRAASAFDGTAERQFHHHLLHQVTYDTVLKEDRRRGHAAVAHWLAARTAGRAPEFLAVTAEHAERAGESALAIDCYEQAAQEAGKRFANALALDCIRKALRMLPEDAVARRFALLKLQYRQGDTLGDRALQHQAMDAQQALLARWPDPQRQALVLADRALLADREGRLDDAFALATEAASLADAVGADEASALAHSELCWLHGLRTEGDDARRHLALALVSAERVRDTAPEREIMALLLGGVVEIQANRYTQARELLEEVLARAEAAHQHRAQLGALNYLCSVSIGLSEHARMRDEATRFLALARRLGNVAQTGAALYLLGFGLNAEGAHAQALASAQDALPLLRATRSRLMEAEALAVIGHAQAGLGQPAAARAAFVEAMAVHEGLAPGGPNALSRQALIAAQDLDLGDLSAARVAVDEVLAARAAGVSFAAVNDRHDVEWACQRVLAAAGDARAPAHLKELQDSLRAGLRLAAGSDEAASFLIAGSGLFSRIMAQAPGETPA